MATCHAGKSGSQQQQRREPGVGASIDDDIGPAFRATLEMLEWPRICEHLAEFSSTQCGKRACLSLPIPPTQQASELLLEETR